jgi:phage tail protein X
MITTDSRYANGNIFRAPGTRKNPYQVVVSRVFPNVIDDYFLYTWKENDRIDMVANRFYGNTSLWWQILDFNPEVLDPWQIPVGTALRIPNV